MRFFSAAKPFFSIMSVHVSHLIKSKTWWSWRRRIMKTFSSFRKATCGFLLCIRKKLCLARKVPALAHTWCCCKSYYTLNWRGITNFSSWTHSIEHTLIIQKWQYRAESDSLLNIREKMLRSGISHFRQEWHKLLTPLLLWLKGLLL